MNRHADEAIKQLRASYRDAPIEDFIAALEELREMVDDEISAAKDTLEAMG
jgi:hypothetical protein